jgi:hypothetical protein
MSFFSNALMKREDRVSSASLPEDWIQHVQHANGDTSSTYPLNCKSDTKNSSNGTQVTPSNVDVAGLSVAGLSIGEILNGHLGKCPLEIYISQWTLASVHCGPLLSIVRTLKSIDLQQVSTMKYL